MRSFLFITIASLAGSLTACSPYDPDLGPSPFLCGPADQNPRCPDGYTCMMNGSGGAEYCLATGGAVPVDASNLMCADDSSLEPNNSIQMAWQTPVDNPKKTFTLSGLSICPSGDKDDYAINIATANENLEVIIEYDPAGADLQGSILNAGGQAIANASPVSGMAGMRRAYTPNLPVGTYYASVFGPMSGSLTSGNYKLSINITGP